MPRRTIRVSYKLNYRVQVQRRTTYRQQVQVTPKGLSVWYSELVMKPGMSLRRSIDAGLSKCEWGVVVLSPHFFNKPWPNYELDGLVTRSMVENKQLILPIWHNVGQAEVVRYSPSLADKFALSTAKDSVADIARQIVEAVRDD